MRPRILAADGQLGDPPVQQRTGLSQQDQPAQPILLRDIEFHVTQDLEQLFHRVAQRGPGGHRDPLVG